MSEQPPEHAQVHAGFCAMLGLPNVGKSTLLNRLLGRKLAAVSPKPQTTRNRIVGILNLAAEALPAQGRGAQLVFIDTPGLARGKGALRRFMREEAMGAVGECDLVLVVLDATDPAQRDPGSLAPEIAADFAEALGRSVPAVVAFNKVDRIDDKRRLLPAIEAFSRAGRYADVVPISALSGDNVDRLAAVVAAKLPVGPPLFPPDMLTDRAERFLAGELVREQLFLQLGEELPYASAVVVEEMRERPEQGDVVVEAIVYVERDSQKGIVVGRGGARIKEVGQRARAEIADLLGCPVHLMLHVKVAEDWSRDDGGISRMGYR